MCLSKAQTDVAWVRGRRGTGFHLLAVLPSTATSTSPLVDARARHPWKKDQCVPFCPQKWHTDSKTGEIWSKKSMRKLCLFVPFSKKKRKKKEESEENKSASDEGAATAESDRRSSLMNAHERARLHLCHAQSKQQKKVRPWQELQMLATAKMETWMVSSPFLTIYFCWN